MTSSGSRDSQASVVRQRSAPNAGDRIEVFDWHPDRDREKWQMATVDHVDRGEIIYRLDVFDQVITGVPVTSDRWREPR